MTALEIIVLGRDATRRASLVDSLRRMGYRAVGVDRLGDSTAQPGRSAPDVLAIDLRDPDLDLPRLRQALMPATPAPPETLEAVERRHIAAMLRHTGGNRRQAAFLLGISRSTLLNKIRRYGIEPPARAKRR